MLGRHGRVAEAAVGWRVLRCIHHLPLWRKRTDTKLGLNLSSNNDKDSQSDVFWVLLLGLRVKAFNQLFISLKHR